MLDTTNKMTFKQVFESDHGGPHSPKKATLRSTILPGWGQAYNRKYWKMPIAYSLIGGAIYSSIYFNRQYQTYRSIFRDEVAYQIALKSNPNAVDPQPNYTYGQAQKLKNDTKQNRDLCFILIGVAYGLQIVDATVDGHLYDFDISDNLSFRPTFSPYRYSNLRGLQVGLTFTLK